MTQIYRRELVNLENEYEAKILVEIAGKSLIQTEPEKIMRVKISDETEEGRKQILSLLSQGYKVESIIPGQNKVENPESFKKFTEDALKFMGKKD